LFLPGAAGPSLPAVRRGRAMPPVPGLGTQLLGTGATPDSIVSSPNEGARRRLGNCCFIFSVEGCPKVCESPRVLGCPSSLLVPVSAALLSYAGSLKVAGSRADSPSCSSGESLLLLLCPCYKKSRNERRSVRIYCLVFLNPHWSK